MIKPMGRNLQREGGRESDVDVPSPGDLERRFGLTRMQSRVARAIADGLSYSEVAARYGISYHTVHSHVKAIYEKTGVSSNVRLLALIRR